MTRAVIGLGSNLGDRARHIAEAVGSLSEHGEYVAASSLYETAPVGGPRQGPYLNAVAVIDTELPARELLNACLDIERSQGRERRERWGPRTLDLDILLFGDMEIDEPGLTIPHPRLTERGFVLVPLLEVDPAAALPDGTRLDSFVASVSDQAVRRVETPVPSRRMTAAVFLVTGVAAVVLWWLMGQIL